MKINFPSAKWSLPNKYRDGYLNNSHTGSPVAQVVDLVVYVHPDSPTRRQISAEFTILLQITLIKNGDLKKDLEYPFFYFKDYFHLSYLKSFKDQLKYWQR